eukprot:CAMPEP_0113552820 /NCGR_PEP_ID=MMETSP0015_2-20120614/15274_1 /TAXON_ID=2838 /ORGANISM="Odontella" /LENGTH=180 /DNA_ID=CAMNT_0000453829 /DNA_START=248 /DNA_END=793 /DNA_ORIENTATION=- /assembly_acc=CAM_ASM_000160
MTMRKGRRSLRKTIGDGASSSKPIRPMGGEEVVARRTNWVPVSGISSMGDLPQEENKVKFVDTEADQLIDGAVNPTGAVSVVTYEGKTYCFASSCSSCKIPLTKAKVLPPNEETGGSDPRISCDFCSATYNVRTGERVEDVGGSGLLGGLVKGLMSAKDKEALPTYDLGERDGKVLINLP